MACTKIFLGQVSFSVELFRFENQACVQNHFISVVGGQRLNIFVW